VVTSENAPPTVLIIEADQLTSDLYQRELGRDVAVATCSNEMTAWEILRTRDVRAVVLEPAGLGAEGWNLLARIKAHPSFSAIPVIVCSTQDERRKGLELGAALFLVKPVLPATLSAVLRQVIGADNRATGKI
jgi:DNA-binding response OmpR family regulator